MGKIVFAGAMSHVLDPDYYQRACGDEGRRKTVECMAEIARMGERLTASRPDAFAPSSTRPPDAPHAPHRLSGA